MMHELPRSVRALSRLIPAREREAIIGDLLEDATLCGYVGARRSVWLTRECAAIAGDLSLERARGWLVVPPMRDVVGGLVVDGRGALRRTHPFGGVVRALVFCGSVATLVLGVEVLVGSLLAAAGL